MLRNSAEFPFQLFVVSSSRYVQAGEHRTQPVVNLFYGFISSLRIFLPGLLELLLNDGKAGLCPIRNLSSGDFEEPP